MNLPEKIRTIDNFKELTFKEKKSAFIAQVYSVNSVKAADEFLSETKKKYYDASHHCFAYKLIDATIRYSDSGEPSGTAGVRILSAIDHFNLSNQLVVVTRYY
ncbi:MAG: YigZ family protein, partial [Ignavibacteriales bacterium]